MTSIENLWENDSPAPTPPRYAYHNHTWRCKHAEGEVIDYLRNAVSAGVLDFGMSDHMPSPDGRWPAERMDLAQMSDYMDAIRTAQAAFPEARMRAGLECEFIPDAIDFYTQTLLGKYGLDYLVLGMHYYYHNGAWHGGFEGLDHPAALRAHTDLTIRAIETGLFAFVAHADLMGCSLAQCGWTADAEAASRDLIAAAVAHNVALEINGYGIRKPWLDTPSGPRPRYPWRPFWELASAMGATVALNADAHAPHDVVSNHQQLVAIRDALGLHEMSAERIPRAARWLSPT